MSAPARIDCTIWLADTASASHSHLALLDPIERCRRERLCMPADQDRFTVAAALLRSVAGARLGIAARDLRVERTCDRCGAPHGKPALPGTGLHVSLSHSEDVVALALTDVAPVGVDVEHLTARDTAGLSHAVLSDVERAAVEAVGPPSARSFYTCWCRKEAVVKATGAGLRVPLVDVVVSPPSKPPRLLSYRGTTLPCTLVDLPLGPRLAARYAAAVAVLADGRPNVVVRHVGESGQAAA